MSDDFDWDLIDRLLTGECTAADLRELDCWCEKDPDMRRYIEGLRQSMGMPPTGRWDPDPAWARLADQTGVEPRPKTGARLTLVDTPPTRQIVPIRRPLLGVAAVAALAVGAAGTWWALAHRRPARSVPAPPQIAMQEFAAARGQRAEMRLRDGTYVKLAPGSRLRVPNDFGAGEREVLLEGQAYFDVTHDETRPFSVRASNVVALDLGTRFTVRAYPEDGRAEVVVTEGQVAVTASRPGAPAVPNQASTPGARPPVILSRGQLARVEPNGDIVYRKSVKVDRYVGWTEGKLTFHSSPLRSVAVELGRWYGVDVQLSDAGLGSRPLTASFDDAPLTEVLQLIRVSLDVTIDQVGGLITIRPRRAGAL